MNQDAKNAAHSNHEYFASNFWNNKQKVHAKQTNDNKLQVLQKLPSHSLTFAGFALYNCKMKFGSDS